MPCRRFLIGLTAICVTAASHTARAAEVTVKNDSFVSGGSNVVFAGFVPGEHGGVRLTAPCDGNIVAVQIGWSSANGGAPQSLQQAIHIFDGATFPTPGSELVVLNAPLLTDGFFNEFRFLDEAQAIPLSVPVTIGQQFYVTLEFAEAPDIQAGDASLFRDVDGCQGGKNVLFATPGGWLNFCIVLTGDVVIRAVIDCGELTGACCLPDGTCSIETASDCASSSGIYRGDLTDCSDPNCPQPVGACCFPAGCLDLLEVDCDMANGVWAGPGTDCATFVCFPMGACCLPDGSCMDNTDPNQCASLDGVFQGDGTDCGTTTCPEPVGACCFGGGGCLLLTDTNCGVAGGTWMGGGTDCSDGSGSGTADACEAGQSCVGDTNGDGDTNITDLGVLLANFGASVPSGTMGDLTGDGLVNITDLGILLGDFGCTSP